MKKRDVISLIRYHAEDNEAAFREEAYEIARDFEASGDVQLAEYIMALLSDANTFVPQMSDTASEFLQKVPPSTSALPLPDAIFNDVKGVVNAVKRNCGVNKFLFQGPPGTGKTESAKQVARLLGREMLSVNFTSLIDSLLGQTSKNIDALFQELNDFAHPERELVLFDEIDALVLNRTDANDLREMGRATSTFLKQLENLDSRIVLIATTNLYECLDKALIRRFDAVVDFERYTREDMLDIAEVLANDCLVNAGIATRDTQLLRKILNQMDEIPYPGELKNMIQSAVAFSNAGDNKDYLRRLYDSAAPKPSSDPDVLKQQGFTVREIATLLNQAKSTVDRSLRVGTHE